MSAFRARLTPTALGIAPDEPDQVLRLGRFREEHPDVIIGDGGFGTWQARIPEPDGETIFTRYTFRELHGQARRTNHWKRRPTGQGARLRTARSVSPSQTTWLPDGTVRAADTTAVLAIRAGNRGICHWGPVVPCCVPYVVPAHVREVEGG